jgi:phosphoribosylaminoimidazole-succinocarboxamide synthase
VRSRLNRVRQRLRAATDEIDGVRSVRPDRLAPLPDAPSSLLDREKERLMQAIDEGKTKVIIDAGDGTVLIRSKDDITADDGAKRDVIDGKGASSTTTTCNVFRLLESNGVPTHFLEQLDAVTFRARRVEMIPLELVARRIATGSFLTGTPTSPTAPSSPTSSSRSSRRMTPTTIRSSSSTSRATRCGGSCPTRRRPSSSASACRPATSSARSRSPAVATHRSPPSCSAQLRELTLRTFEIVEQAWAELGGTYLDVKIECGFDREDGTLVVADVIDSDSGRLRFGDKDMSKQAYRDGGQSLPDIKKSFDEVAALTKQFG